MPYPVTQLCIPPAPLKCEQHSILFFSRLPETHNYAAVQTHTHCWRAKKKKSAMTPTHPVFLGSYYNNHTLLSSPECVYPLCCFLSLVLPGTHFALLVHLQRKADQWLSLPVVWLKRSCVPRGQKEPQSKQSMQGWVAVKRGPQTSLYMVWDFSTILCLNNLSSMSR